MDEYPNDLRRTVHTISLLAMGFVFGAMWCQVGACFDPNHLLGIPGFVWLDWALPATCDGFSEEWQGR